MIFNYNYYICCWMCSMLKTWFLTWVSCVFCLSFYATKWKHFQMEVFGFCFVAVMIVHITGYNNLSILYISLSVNSVSIVFILDFLRFLSCCNCYKFFLLQNMSWWFELDEKKNKKLNDFNLFYKCFMVL